MAESLAALGAASSVITLVEFCWKLLSSAKEVYRSANGQNESHFILAIVIEDIERLNAPIQESLKSKPRSSYSKTDEGLKDLLKQSSSISRKLLKALDRLKTDRNSSMWQSLHVALREVWQKDELDAFFQSLMSLQTRVTAHIQMGFRDQLSEISIQFQQMKHSYEGLGINIDSQLQDLKHHVINAARNVETRHLGNSMDTTASTTQELQRADLEDVLSSLKHLSNSVRALRERDRFLEPIEALLKKLSFPMMTARKTRIPQAHIDTYQWIFEPATSDGGESIHFQDWLRSLAGVYWIQGKPGSGKSTLMKFVANSDKTEDALQTWAQGSVLLKASAFFWYAGAKMQKSQVGLFRSILYQLVIQHPEFTEMIHGTLNQHSKRHDSDWVNSVGDLLLVLTTLIKKHPSLRFCFFIDGLDEYEEDGKVHSDLINAIWELTLPSNSKACVSSRPWSVFRDAFENDRSNSFVLETLTRPDIRKYVKDHLRTNRALSHMKGSQRLYSYLSHEICLRAQGVFLWVHLVVRDLLEGLTNGDTSAMLANRLSRFPPDLDRFFQHMIETIDPIYVEHTARLLDVARKAENPVTMVTYSFIDDLIDDVDLWRDETTTPMSDDEFSFRRDQMRRRLDGRCKGLLELSNTSESKTRDYTITVDFIHRTVHEFLMSAQSVQKLIDSHIDPKMTPLVLVKATLLEMRHAPRFSEEHMVDVLQWARRADLSLGEGRESSNPHHELHDVLCSAERLYNLNACMVPFLDRASATGVLLIIKPVLAPPMRRDNDPDSHRLSSSPSPSSYPAAAAAALAAIAAEGRGSSGATLLYAAVGFGPFSRSPYYVDGSGLTVIQTHILWALLQAGVSPNDRLAVEGRSVGRHSVWERILEDFDVTREGREDWARVIVAESRLEDDVLCAMRLLLRHGASLDANTKGHRNPSLTARDLFRKIFTPRQLAELAEAAEAGRLASSRTYRLKAKARSILPGRYSAKPVV